MNRPMNGSKDESDPWQCIVVVMMERCSDFYKHVAAIRQKLCRDPRSELVSITPSDLISKKGPNREGRKTIKLTSHCELRGTGDERRQAELIKETLLIKQFSMISGHSPEKRKSSINPSMTSLGSHEISSSKYSLKEGSTIFFVLSDFYSVNTLSALLCLGVPLKAVFSVGEWIEKKNKKGNIESSNAEAFWNEYHKQMDTDENMSSNLINIHISHQANLNDPFDVEILGFYEVFVGKLNDLQQFVEDYEKFRCQMVIIDVAEVEEPLRSMDTYLSSIQEIPIESVTIEMILHFMVQQVEEMIGDTSGSPERFLKAARPPENVEKTPENVKKCTKSASPVLVKNNDLVHLQTFHLKSDLDFREIVFNILKNMPYALIWQTLPENNEGRTAWYRSQCQFIWRCLEWRVPEYVFERLIHLFMFKKLTSSPTNTTCTFRKVEFLDKIKFRGRFDKDLRDLKEFLFCDEIINLVSERRPQEVHFSYLDFLFLEEMNALSFLQALRSAMNEFAFADYYYSNLTDHFLFRFHNNLKENVCLVEEKGSLISPVEFSGFKYFEGDKINYIEVPDEYSKDGGGTRRIFYGFNMGPKRVEVNTETASVYTEDSGLISVKRTSWVNIKKSSINICSSMNGITLMCNYETDDSTYLNDTLMFHTYLENGTIFAYTVDVRTKGCATEGVKEDKKKPKKKATEVVYEVDSSHALCLPTGLKITPSVDFTYIKLEYINKSQSLGDVANELFRIYTVNGAVIIFYDGDIIEVYYSNGTYVQITKTLRQVCNQCSIDDEQGILGSEEEPLKSVLKIISHEVHSYSGEHFKFFHSYDVTNFNVDPCNEKLTLCVSEDPGESVWVEKSDGSSYYWDSESNLTVQFPNQLRIKTASPKISIEFEFDEDDVPSEESSHHAVLSFEAVFQHPSFPDVEYQNDEWSVILPESRVSYYQQKNVSIFHNESIINFAADHISFTTGTTQGPTTTLFNFIPEDYPFFLHIDGRKNEVHVDVSGKMTKFQSPEHKPSCISLRNELGRFFVGSRDLTGYELLLNHEHFKLTEKLEKTRGSTSIKKILNEGCWKTLQECILSTESDLFLNKILPHITGSTPKAFVPRPLPKEVKWFFHFEEQPKKGNDRKKLDCFDYPLATQKRPCSKIPNASILAVKVSRIMCLNPQLKNLPLIFLNAVNRYISMNNTILENHARPVVDGRRESEIREAKRLKLVLADIQSRHSQETEREDSQQSLENA